MEKILFILPNLSTGGTLSSLSGLLNYINNKRRFDILSLTGSLSSIALVDNNLIESDSFVNYYYSRCANGLNIRIVLYFMVKFLKKICGKFRVDCEKIMFKYFAKQFDNKYDIVVAFEEGSATELGSCIKSPLKFAWVHCDYSRYHNSGSECGLYEKFNKIICVSEYTSDVFKSIYPTVSKRVVPIKNILDYSQIIKKSKEIITDELFEESTFVIISVGRFTPVKRFADIPQIAKRIKDKGLIFKWYILGPIVKRIIFWSFREISRNIMLRMSCCI